MFDTALFPVVAAIGLMIGGYCFFRSLRWEAALTFMVIALCFGGIAAVNMGSGSYAIVFRDLFIILPLYIGFFGGAEGPRMLNLLPLDVLAMLVLLLTVIFICVFASPTNVGEIAIGLKVWLFYVPLLAVGVALAARRDVLVRFLRVILLWGFAAATIGLIQSLLVRLVGYERTMEWFFGANAIKVTQDFTVFDVAGGIYRIPGTFSFVSQYGNFLYLYLVVTVIESNIDPDDQYKQIARIGVILATIAGVLCGVRQAIILFPATLAVFALGGLLSTRMLLIAPIGAAAGTAIIALSGLDLLEYFSVGRELAESATGHFIGEQLASGLDFGFLGAGIGSSTTAARYAMGMTVEAGPAAIGLESFYGKAGAELGWFGFITIAMLMATVVLRSVVSVLQHVTRPSHAIILPLAVFLVSVVISSFKGSPLDADPGNMFFWLFLGLMTGISRFGYDRDALVEVADDDPAPEEEEAIAGERAPGE